MSCGAELCDATPAPPLSVTEVLLGVLGAAAVADEPEAGSSTLQPSTLICLKICFGFGYFCQSIFPSAQFVLLAGSTSASAIHVPIRTCRGSRGYRPVPAVLVLFFWK